MIKTEQTIEKIRKFQQIFLKSQTSLSQNFDALASFLRELLGFVFQMNFIFLWHFTDFDKNGKTIKKTRNFQQIFLNSQTSLSQDFNGVASLAFELIGFVFYRHFIFLCKLTDFGKSGISN